MKIVKVSHQVRLLPGSSKSQLTYCSDGNYYAVKLRANGSASRNLIAEYVGAQLAHLVDLPVPKCQIVAPPDGLEWSDCGPHVGSKFLARSPGSMSIDLLPSHFLGRVLNLETFAGVLAFDEWTANRSPRKAVFHRRRHNTEFTASFINFDRCFGDGLDWNISSADRCCYCNPLVYKHVINWDSFEPYLSRITTITPDSLWSVANGVPQQWREDEPNYLERIIETLLLRRTRVHHFLVKAIETNSGGFERWSSTAQVFFPCVESLERISMPMPLSNS